MRCTVWTGATLSAYEMYSLDWSYTVYICDVQSGLELHCLHMRCAVWSGATLSTYEMYSLDWSYTVCI
ncbi:hypothetical protein DPMN_193932 [Dreissena polymorpha]|uniref:Uncharacterized protein n=1 Tax=Dreissena polymorpha TaxID=45954 RepID=A0A9D3Y4H1_DREPO|nr:hypothetical protein DPMN_193932 [Dreissena polymorpha]